MQKSPSFFGRIVLAMVLMAGFYILAIALAAGLILIPVAEVVFANRLHIKLAIISVVAGCMILWSILPRWDRFVAPGPRLTEEDQPELFRELKGVAQATQQTMPSEVYALPEMNAWVANRGGMMGLGSRRIMGIGVPLMQVLTTQQFRSVLAHEFGHYYGGDTKLGPWIYVTRAAIIRTVVNLANNGSSILMKPFEWYMMLFLWLTQKVSRQQEYTADALAAETVGPRAISDALKVIQSHAGAFGAYWEYEYAPVLQGGYQAPLSRGFEQFIAKSKTGIDESLKEALKPKEADLFDSHPSLKDRLDSIAQHAGPPPPSIDPPAIDLLRNVGAMESEMIRHLATAMGVKAPQPIAWEDVGEAVLVPNFTQFLSNVSGKLEGVQLWQAAEMLGSAEHRDRLLSLGVRQQLSDPEQTKGLAARLVGVWATLALRQQGWRILNSVAESVYAEKDGVRAEPFSWMNDLVEGKKSLADVQEQLEEYGIDEADFQSILVSSDHGASRP